MNREILDEEEVGSVSERNANFEKIEGLIRLFFWAYLMYFGLSTEFSLERVLGAIVSQIFLINHIIQGIRNIRGLELKYSKRLTILSLIGSTGFLSFLVFSLSKDIKLINAFVVLRIILFVAFFLSLIAFDLRLLFMKKRKN